MEKGFSLFPVEYCASAHSFHALERHREVGPHVELFFIIKASNELLPTPFVSAETLQACALIGLHLLAAEGEDGLNSECRAIDASGQDWSSEVVALFLEDWELGRVASSCHMAMDLLCQEMRVSSESLGSPFSL